MMKLLCKQRVLSWLDRYDIYEENNQVVFSVEGQLSWGHCLYVYDANHCHIATLKEKVWAFLPKFEIIIGEQSWGFIEKQITFFKPVFYFPYKDWMIEGNFWEWDYEIKDSHGKVIATANKVLFKLTDTYQIEVFNQENAIYALMVMLAIDANKCSRN